VQPLTAGKSQRFKPDDQLLALLNALWDRRAGDRSDADRSNRRWWAKGLRTPFKREAGSLSYPTRKGNQPAEIRQPSSMRHRARVELPVGQEPQHHARTIRGTETDGSIMSRLEGKVAVIIGGNSGIGLAIAQRLVERDNQGENSYCPTR
jgi:hypothetical protein